MFEKNIGPGELASMAGLSEVMLLKYRRKDVGPPWTQGETGRIHYPIAGVLAWLVERHTRSLVKRIEALEKREAAA